MPGQFDRRCWRRLNQPFADGGVGPVRVRSIGESEGHGHHQLQSRAMRQQENAAPSGMISRASQRFSRDRSRWRTPPAWRSAIH